MPCWCSRGREIRSRVKSLSKDADGAVVGRGDHLAEAEDVFLGEPLRGGVLRADVKAVVADGLQSGEGGAAFRKLSAHVEMDARLGGKFHSAQEFGAPKAGGPDLDPLPQWESLSDT